MVVEATSTLNAKAMSIFSSFAIVLGVMLTDVMRVV
jgi:hypothetical protein